MFLTVECKSWWLLKPPDSEKKYKRHDLSVVSGSFDNWLLELKGQLRILTYGATIYLLVVALMHGDILGGIISLI